MKNQLVLLYRVVKNYHNITSFSIEMRINSKIVIAYIKETGIIKERNMDLALLSMQKEINILVFGKKINSTVEEDILIKMEIVLRVHGRMV